MVHPRGVTNDTVVIRNCRLVPWALLFTGTLMVGCGEAPPDATSVAQQSAAPASETGGPIRLNMDEIFPPGAGRELVLNNCQSCHVWVPIVILQMDESQWYRNSLEHRERVEGLGDEEFEILYDYLVSTFTPDRPVPELPAALLEAWTSY